MSGAERAYLTERVELLKQVASAKQETAAAKWETVAQMRSAFCRGLTAGAFGMLGICLLVSVLIGTLT